MKSNCTQTASNIIQVSADASPGYTNAGALTGKSANKVSELLTINHALYHTRFNGGFHSRFR